MIMGSARVFQQIIAGHVVVLSFWSVGRAYMVVSRNSSSERLTRGFCWDLPGDVPKLACVSLHHLIVQNLALNLHQLYESGIVLTPLTELSKLLSYPSIILTSPSLSLVQSLTPQQTHPRHNCSSGADQNPHRDTTNTVGYQAAMFSSIL